MTCPMCGVPHERPIVCPRLQLVAASLNHFTALAFVTDPLNRCVFVNQTFARMIGDPIRDRLPSKLRFIDALVIGPYRDRFPRGKQEVAQCAAGLLGEVEAGRLAPGAIRLLEHALTLDEDVYKLAKRTDTPWDGTVVVKDHGGKLLLIREQVVAVADHRGKDSGFHVSWWLAAEEDPPEFAAGLSESPTGVASLLTPRQLEVARWYAAGHNSRAVAERTGITLKTARDHLEEVYSRLDLHSRAELAALLVREGLL